MSDAQFAAYEAKHATATRLESAVLPHNRQVLFEALMAAGIVLVTITFDGYGDSGQFEKACAFDADNTEIAIPTGDISIKSVHFDTGTVIEVTTPIRDYIETLACDFLEETHSGWEDGEGSYGEFRFSAAERTITLDYNERYVESYHHEHEF